MAIEIQMLGADDLRQVSGGKDYGQQVDEARRLGRRFWASETPFNREAQKAWESDNNVGVRLQIMPGFHGKGIPVEDIPAGVIPCRGGLLPEVWNGRLHCAAG
jgi:hypothetical protein